MEWDDVITWLNIATIFVVCAWTVVMHCAWNRRVYQTGK